MIHTFFFKCELDKISISVSFAIMNCSHNLLASDMSYVCDSTNHLFTCSICGFKNLFLNVFCCL